MFAGVDHVSIPLSLPGLRQGIHAAASHLRRRKGRSNVPALREQTRAPARCRFLCRHLEEELAAGFPKLKSAAGTPLQRQSHVDSCALPRFLDCCFHRGFRTQCAIEKPLATTHPAMNTAIVHSNGADWATRITARPYLIASSASRVNRSARERKLMTRILQIG